MAACLLCLSDIPVFHSLQKYNMHNMKLQPSLYFVEHCYKTVNYRTFITSLQVSLIIFFKKSCIPHHHKTINKNSQSSSAINIDNKNKKKFKLMAAPASCDQVDKTQPDKNEGTRNHLGHHFVTNDYLQIVNQTCRVC